MFGEGTGSLHVIYRKDRSFPGDPSSKVPPYLKSISVLTSLIRHSLDLISFQLNFMLLRVGPVVCLSLPSLFYPVIPPSGTVTRSPTFKFSYKNKSRGWGKLRPVENSDTKRGGIDRNRDGNGEVVLTGIEGSNLPFRKKGRIRTDGLGRRWVVTRDKGC